MKRLIMIALLGVATSASANDNEMCKQFAADVLSYKMAVAMTSEKEARTAVYKRYGKAGEAIIEYSKKISLKDDTFKAYASVYNICLRDARKVRAQK